MSLLTPVGSPNSISEPVFIRYLCTLASRSKLPFKLIWDNMSSMLWHSDLLGSWHIPKHHEHYFGSRITCFVIVFFDDILVYSRSFDDHLHHLALVFSWLSADQWKVKLSKCTFAQQSIAYLGHIISEAGVATDPAKVQAITDWPTPTNVRALRGFLGLAGYYRKFVRHFGIIAWPLTDLLKKNTLFIWFCICRPEDNSVLRSSFSPSGLLGALSHGDGCFWVWSGCCVATTRPPAGLH